MSSRSTPGEELALSSVDDAGEDLAAGRRGRFVDRPTAVLAHGPLRGHCEILDPNDDPLLFWRETAQIELHDEQVDRFENSGELEAVAADFAEDVLLDLCVA